MVDYTKRPPSGGGDDAAGGGGVSLNKRTLTKAAPTVSLEQRVSLLGVPWLAFTRDLSAKRSMTGQQTGHWYDPHQCPV